MKTHQFNSLVNAEVHMIKRKKYGMHMFIIVVIIIIIAVVLYLYI